MMTAPTESQPADGPAPVLVLDIGNVCLKVEFDALLQAMGFRDLAAVEAFDPGGRLRALSNAVERGEISTDAFLRDFGAGLPQPQPAAATAEIWGRIIGAEIEGMSRVVDTAVAAGVRVVFLSDICDLHYDLSVRQLSFADRVDGAVLSYEVGALKPDARMYEAVERAYCDGGVPLLYADDKEGNVRAAADRGWPVYHFGDAATMHDRLREQLRLVSA